MPLFRCIASALLVVALLCGGAQANPQLLLDMRTGEVLFEEEGNVPWYPASLTKLMTAYVTFEAITAGRVALDTEVILSRHAVRQPPSSTGLPLDSAMSLQDALYLIMVKSANDVAVAIAETVSGSESAFVTEMNQTARAMGLTATHFVNPHGLHDPAHVSSARDLALLGLWIRQKYPQYDPIFRTQAVRLGNEVMESNNHLLTEFAGTTGMKTGYVCASGLNIVATVERAGRQLMAVVLGGSSGRERDEMTALLFTRGLRGEFPGTGQTVMAMQNALEVPPLNMRPLICGPNAREYVDGRKAAFPFGLEGQPSYLTDQVSTTTYVATNLGRFRDLQLPRRRPADMPVVIAVAEIEADEPAELEAQGDGGLPPAADLDPSAPQPAPRPRPGLQSP